ncbi:MAG: Gfo/Idh/MocA family protein [Myxococcota bacterium]
MKAELGWGIIGTGGIAAAFAESLAASRRHRVVNVVGSSAAKGESFAKRWRLPRAASNLVELLSDPEVEAVYVASPHPSHLEHSLAVIAARKAVLCEKPLATNVLDAQHMIEAARVAGVFLMEAFMYRCHPLIAETLKRLRTGAIGRIRHVRADFGYRTEHDPRGRLFDPALGGGAILDVGGYPVSFARLIAGLAEGKPFAEPVELNAHGHLGFTGVDELAFAELAFASGVTAEIACATRHELGTRCVVFGDEGRLELPNPWLPRGDRLGLESDLVVVRDGAEPERICVTTELATYAIEADVVADTLPALEPSEPSMSWADTLGNMRVMEAWSQALRSV